MKIWKTLSLTILQKARKHALERTPKVGPHTVGQRADACDLRIHSTPSAEARNRCAHQKTCGRPLELRSSEVSENFITAQTLLAWTERDRDGMEGGVTRMAKHWLQRPEITQARSEGKTIPSFQRAPPTATGGPRGQRIGPQRTLLRP